MECSYANKILWCWFIMTLHFLNSDTEIDQSWNWWIASLTRDLSPAISKTSPLSLWPNPNIVLSLLEVTQGWRQQILIQMRFRYTQLVMWNYLRLKKILCTEYTNCDQLLLFADSKLSWQLGTKPFLLPPDEAHLSRPCLVQLTRFLMYGCEADYLHISFGTPAKWRWSVDGDASEYFVCSYTTG